MKLKICVTIIFFLGLTFIAFSKNVLATSSYVNPCPGEPVTSFCNINQIMQNNIKALNFLLIGDPKNPTSYKQSLSGNLISGVGLLISTPPVSSHDYLAYLGNNFHIPGTPTTVYAAPGGTGYYSLAPVLKIWTTTRNLAYFFFAIVFVVAGVMIMFRMKSDPKTVISIQSALPKIIIALILVTFSYAIAGFLIDLMYVALNLLMTVFDSMGFANISDYIRHDLGNKTLLHFVINGDMGFIITSSAASVGNILDTLTGQIPVAGNIMQLVTSGIAALVVAVAIIYALFKTWIMLLNAYAQIILGIIIAPMQIMFDAIPGQNQFIGWLKNMLANVMAFPAVLAMIFLAMALGTNMGLGVGTKFLGDIGSIQNGFVPPFIGGNNQLAVQSLIGLAILLTTPKALEMIQEIIKSPKNKFGNAWGEAVSWAWDKSPLRGTRDAAWGAAKKGTYGRWHDENVLPGQMEEEQTRKWNAEVDAGFHGSAASRKVIKNRGWKGFLPPNK